MDPSCAGDGSRMDAILMHIRAMQHARCDRLFVAIEADVAGHRRDSARLQGASLHATIDWHFNAEGSPLFPALDAVVCAGGPAHVRRHEQPRVRARRDRWLETPVAHDRAECEGPAEALLILLQQHNSEEKDILDPMCAQMLGERGAAIVAELQAGAAGPCPL
jgi:hypothetical protein